MDSATMDRAAELGIDLDFLFAPKAGTATVRIPEDAILLTDELVQGYGLKSARGAGRRLKTRAPEGFKLRTGDGPQGHGLYIWKVEVPATV